MIMANKEKKTKCKKKKENRTKKKRKQNEKKTERKWFPQRYVCEGFCDVTSRKPYPDTPIMCVGKHFPVVDTICIRKSISDVHVDVDRDVRVIFPDVF